MLKSDKLLFFLLYAYIFLYIAIPINGVEKIVGFNIHVVVLALLILKAFSSNISLRDNIGRKYIGLQILLFFCFFFTFLKYGLSTGYLYGVFMNFIENTMFIFILCECVKTRKDTENALLAYSLGAGFISALMFLGPTIGLTVAEMVGNNEDRLMVYGRDLNEMSMVLLVAFCISLYFIRINRNRGLHVVLAFLYVMGVFSSGSRTGVVLFLVLLIINALFGNFKKKIVFLMISSVLLSVSFYFLMNYLPESLLLRYMGISEELEEGSMASRRDIWNAARRLIENSSVIDYIFGNGYNSFRYEIVRFYGYQKDAHNVYIKTFVEYGIIGATALVAYIYYFVKRAFFMIRDNDSRFLVVSILAVMLISFTMLSWMYNLLVWITFILIHKYCRNINI